MQGDLGRFDAEPHPGSKRDLQFCRCFYGDAGGNTGGTVGLIYSANQD